jgi:hypothetical protein
MVDESPPPSNPPEPQKVSVETATTVSAQAKALPTDPALQASAPPKQTLLVRMTKTLSELHQRKNPYPPLPEWAHHEVHFYHRFYNAIAHQAGFLALLGILIAIDALAIANPVEQLEQFSSDVYNALNLITALAAYSLIRWWYESLWATKYLGHGYRLVYLRLILGGILLWLVYDTSIEFIAKLTDP